jgi:hypothetical protein
MPRPGISLDLTGATLIDFTFTQVSVIQVGFGGATFQGAARFGGATFQGSALFSGATFQGDALFGRATFQGTAWFGSVTFQGSAWFGGATFQRAALFSGATFQGTARFGEATFEGSALFSEAHVLHLDDRDSPQIWPDGWAVLPDPTDPSRGTLVHAEQTEEPQPAVHPPTTGSRRQHPDADQTE